MVVLRTEACWWLWRSSPWKPQGGSGSPVVVGSSWHHGCTKWEIFFCRDPELFALKDLRIRFWDSSFFLMTVNDTVSKLFWLVCQLPLQKKVSYLLDPFLIMKDPCLEVAKEGCRRDPPWTFYQETSRTNSECWAQKRKCVFLGLSCLQIFEGILQRKESKPSFKKILPELPNLQEASPAYLSWLVPFMSLLRTFDYFTYFFAYHLGLFSLQEGRDHVCVIYLCLPSPGCSIRCVINTQ